MWLDSLIAYSLQIAVLISAGMLLCALFRVEQPNVRLAWLQIILATCLLAPLWQPWADPVSERLVDFRFYTTDFSTAGAGGTWPWTDLVVFALGAGVAARWLWLGLGLIRLRRYRQQAERLLRMPNSVTQLQSRLGVEPEFYLSNELESPLTFGFRRAVILLPWRFPELPDATQVAINCHELCHVQRNDWLVTFCEEVIRGLFWFHPFVRWLIRHIQLTREQVVDRQVVEITGSREAYLDALVEIAKARVHPPLAMASSFLNQRQITKRVEALLKEVHMSKARMAVSAVIMLVVLAGAQWFSGATFPLQSAGQVPAGDVYSVHEDGVTAPSLIHKLEPDYTPEARDLKLEGTVILSLEVWPDGQAHNIEVVQPLGLGLDESAVEAIEQWVFEPGVKDGERVPVAGTVEVNFRLL